MQKSSTFATTFHTRLSLYSSRCAAAPRRRRLFSTSSARCAEGDKPSFPGAFGGARGKFGAFASKATNSKDANDGLLPHERAARKQTAQTRAEPAQTKREPNPPQDRTTGQSRPNQRLARGGKHAEQAALSRSVLANVFGTSAQPRKPSVAAAQTDSSSKKEDTTRFSSPRGGSQSRHPTHADTGVRSGTRHSRRPLKRFNSGGKDDASGKRAEGAGNQEQDFWGELDSRVNTLGEQQNSSKPPVQNEGFSRRFKARHPPEHNHPSHVGDEPAKSDHSVPPAHTKKSRFDREEQHLDNRRNRKNTRQQANRFRGDDEWDEDSADRWERQQEKKAEKEARKRREAEQPKTVPIFLPEFISAANLAQALKQRPSGFLRDMEEMGFENVTSDTIMTGDTAALIAMEYGFEPTVDTGSQQDLRPAPFPEDISSLPSRPPVVTIMGHVDHGKTTLLDWLRKSSVAAQEHGGITQHIGAFVVQMSTGKQITFLDTPGHAAFLSMRQRGANVTDIVVLVVAADDSVKPQTIEAIKHAKAAQVPIIVAINKIDKEDARIDQVKADLSRNGVEIEDYGGDVQVVCVSGKTGQGMPDLEENIVTLSEVLDVRAPADGMAEGWVLESSVKQDGKTATVLVKRGALRAGDIIAAGKTWARIRVLRNEAGVEIAEAPPGTPVEILGWRELPTAGEMVIQAPDEDAAKTAIEYRLEKAEREENSAQVAEQEQRLREKAAAEAAAAEASENPAEAAEPSILTQNFVVKADVAGSVEAVSGSILEQGNHEVCAKVLRSSAGQITEYDVDHASVSKSIIVNFNSTIQPHIKHRAEEAKVKILDHTVIYHVVDDVRNSLSDLLPMTVTHRVNGEADILQVFPINIKKRTYRNIAGCRVRNGAVRKGSMVKVLRKGKVVHTGKLLFVSSTL